MNYIKSNHLSLLIILWLVVSPMIFGGANIVVGGAGTADDTYLTSDVHVGTAGGKTGTFTVDSAATATFNSAVTFNGAISATDETVVDGFTQGGGCLATSTTASTYTITQANLLAYNCFVITQNLGAYTWTLPATSTMTTLLPTVGDYREWLFFNASSTATATLTMAAGAGINLYAISNAEDVVDGAEVMQVRCIRYASTASGFDVLCVTNELVDAN